MEMGVEEWGEVRCTHIQFLSLPVPSTATLHALLSHTASGPLALLLLTSAFFAWCSPPLQLMTTSDML
jgi:hypothetical protein